MAKRTLRHPARQPSPQPQTTVTHTTIAQWSGPLPPPAALEHFNQIIPNGAERILAMVEEEQRFRIDHDTKIIVAQINDTRRGHYIGWGITIAAIAGAAGSAYLGAHPTVSIAIVGLPVVAMLQSIIGSKSGK